MKIIIEKIAKADLEIIKYLSDDIFAFKLNSWDLFDKGIEAYKEKLTRNDRGGIQYIDDEILRNKLNEFGTREELIQINLNHVFRAERYYTNGQKLISILKKDERYEIGIHKDIRRFAGYFYDTPMFADFSLKYFKMQSYEVFEKVEAEIGRALSNIEVKRIPIRGSNQNGSLEIRKVYPLSYVFRYEGKEFTHTLGEGNLNTDRITTQIINDIKPNILQCCRNCTYFQYSGMSYGMDGAAGYCQLLREKVKEPSVKETLNNLWDWCGEFEINEKIKNLT